MLEDLIDQRDALLQNAAARSARTVATGADSLVAASRDAGSDLPPGPLPASMQAAGTGFDPTLVDDINAFFDAQYGPSVDAAAATTHAGEQSPRAQAPGSSASAAVGADGGPSRSFGGASTSTASSLRDLLITPRAVPSKAGADGDSGGRFFAPDGDAGPSAACAADVQHDRRRSLTDE